MPVALTPADLYQSLFSFRGRFVRKSLKTHADSRVYNCQSVREAVSMQVC